MSLALNTSGHFVSSLDSGGAPVLSNITPAEETTPGAPGGFSSSFSIARVTPIEFDITGIPAGQGITIAVKLAGQMGTYHALDFDGEWLWPFDDGNSTIGDLGTEPVHVALLPRGGWPPGTNEVETASFTKATE